MGTLTITQGLQIALYGFVTVFIMLATLMILIMIMGKIVDSSQKKEAPVVNKEPEKVVEEETSKVDTTEYVGQISLIDVDEKTAACIMAIISDQTQIPLSNLIFKKITFIGEE